MKRLLFFVLLYFLSMGMLFPQIVVTGQVKDTAGHPVTGGHVSLYFKNSGEYADTAVVNGHYTVIMQRPGKNDTLTASFDGCTNSHFVQQFVDMAMDTVIMPDIIIDCKPDIIVPVEGYVVDTLGLPLPIAQVVTYAYPDFEMTTTDPNGSFEFNVYMPTLDDSLLTLRVLDACGNPIFYHLTLHYPDTAFANIQVPCGLKPKIRIDGKIIDTKNRGLSNIVVWAQEGQDTTKYMCVADNDYKFLMELPIPPDSTNINLWVDQVDTNENLTQATATVVFNGHDYLYSTTIRLDSNSDPVQMVNINGNVMTPNESYAPGIPVVAWFKSNPSVQGKSISDRNGYYEIHLAASPHRQDTLFVKATDACDSNYYEKEAFTFGQTDYYIDLYGINCPGNPPLINISGTVKDRSGHPAAGILVSVKDISESGNETVTTKGEVSSDNPLQCVTNQYGYYHISFDAPLQHPTNYMVSAVDACENLYSKQVIFDYPKLDYDSVDLVVRCSQEDMYTWEGFVRSSDSTPLPGVRIMGYVEKDSMMQIVTVTDKNGHYIFRAGDPLDSLIIVKVVDGCGNVVKDSVHFFPNKYHYVKDYIMSCPGPMPDSVINFIGTITDSAGHPADNQIVKVAVIDTTNQDTTSMFTITDPAGFYSISLPIPENNSLLIVSLNDDCQHNYKVTDTFDFTNYVYKNDFKISCLPSFTNIPPKLALGYDPDWQEFNKFTFYLKAKNIPDSLIKAYVWKLAFDTIATPVPTITYTFPAEDTCFNIGVKIITVDGREMTSPLLNICIQDPFKQFQKDCYADFMISRVNLAQNIFEFIPFVQSKEGYLPSEATWDFGDGNTITLTPPDTLDKPVQHQYLTKGNYTVTYSITFQDTSNNQCSTQWSNPIWVGHDVWYPDSCAAVFYVVLDSTNYKKVHFEDISYPGNNSSINYYYWDFGDGNVGYAPSPTHEYDTAGTYDVTMQIITSSGCTDQRDAKIKIQKGLEPLFFFPDTVFYKAGKGYGVKFRNISKKKSDKWGWDFGDAEKSTLQTSSDTVVHYYADTGGYVVTLTNLASGAAIAMFIHVASSTEVTPESVSLIPGTLTQIQNNEYKFEQIKVYPNPATDRINVILPEQADQVKLEIINLNGQIIKTIYAYGSKQLQIGVKDLPSGIYLLRSTHNNKFSIKRFVKR